MRQQESDAKFSVLCNDNTVPFSIVVNSSFIYTTSASKNRVKNRILYIWQMLGITEAKKIVVPTLTLNLMQLISTNHCMHRLKLKLNYWAIYCNWFHNVLIDMLGTMIPFVRRTQCQDPFLGQHFNSKSDFFT